MHQCTTTCAATYKKFAIFLLRFSVNDAQFEFLSINFGVDCKIFINLTLAEKCNFILYPNIQFLFYWGVLISRFVGHVLCLLHLPKYLGIIGCTGGRATYFNPLINSPGS